MAIPFVAIFWHNMNTKIGVVIYMFLKHSSDYIYSKYIWVHESNSRGSSVLAEISFLAFLVLHGNERGVVRWDSAHVTPRVKLCIDL